MPIQTDFYRCKICGNRFSAQHLVCPVCKSVNRIVPIERDRLSFAGTQEVKEVELRFCTGVPEVDRVMRGVFSYHIISILAGQEGNGKSTLATQIAYWLAREGARCIYFSTEESLNKLLERARRLDCLHKDLEFIAVKTIQDIFNVLAQKDIDFFVVDSVQALKDLTEEGRVGEKNQLLSVVYKFTEIVRKNNIFCLLISHLSKSGRVAGPSTIAYQVDAVFLLDRTRDKLSPERLLFSYKNRYSTTTYIANLIMTYSGFQVMKYHHFVKTDREGIVYSIVNLPASGGLVTGGYNYQEVVSYNSSLDNRGIHFIGYKPQDYFVHFLKKYKKPFTVKIKVESTDPYIQLPIFVSVLSLIKKQIIPSNYCVIGGLEPDGSFSSPADILVRIHRALDYGFDSFILSSDSEKFLTDLSLFTQDINFYFLNTIDELEEWLNKNHNNSQGGEKKYEEEKE